VAKLSGSLAAFLGYSQTQIPKGCLTQGQKEPRHFERSRPTFSSAFARANASACAERNLSLLFLICGLERNNAKEIIRIVSARQATPAHELDLGKKRLKELLHEEV